MSQPSIFRVELNQLPVEEFLQQLLAADYLGREHFIAFHEVVRPDISRGVGRAAFSLLVARHAFPNYTKNPDMAAYGLEVRRRQAAGLGVLPEFAQYTQGSGMTRRNAEFAVGATSLSYLMNEIKSGDLATPERFGEQSLLFLADLADHLKEQ